MDIKKIEDILKSISNDILTEDVKTSIAKTFNETVESKVAAQLQLSVQNELSKMDDEHSKKLQTLIEAIDEDHTNKFKTVIAKIDETHTKKLKDVIAKYETELKEGAEKLRNELIGQVSNYLDLYIKETIPEAQLKEAVENIRARKMLEEIKKIVAVDPEFISENFKEALKDGHDQIEKLREDMNQKTKENVDLNQKLIGIESKMLLESKVKDLPENKKNFVMKLMEGKKPEEIEANFKYVTEMYEKDETEKISAEADKATGETKTVKATVDAPKAVITENVQSDGDKGNTEVGTYLEELKRSY